MDISQLITKAKYAGWDPDTRSLKMETLLENIDLLKNFSFFNNSISICNEIYSERKVQISQWLDIQMLFPSFKSAQVVHETMMGWVQLIKTVPHLSSTLIEGEIRLVKNLCVQSKQGFMPGERLIYTAYSTLNNKKSYDQTFSKELEEVIAAAQEEERRLKTLLIDEIKEQYDKLCNKEKTEQNSEGKITPEFLRLHKQILEGINTLRLFYGFGSIEQRLQQLKELKEKQKPYAIKKTKKINSQICEIENERLNLEAKFAEEVHDLLELKIKVNKKISIN